MCRMTLCAQYWHRFSNDKGDKIMWRPIAEDDKLWSMVLIPKTVNLQKAVNDSEYLHECIRDVTKNPDIKITKVRSLSEWRLNERVADKFSVGRVFIGGGGGARFGVVSPLPVSRGEPAPFGLPTGD